MNQPNMSARAQVAALLTRSGIASDEVAHEEMWILVDGGVTVSSFRSAIDAWSSAYRVGDDWGYIKSVALRRYAETRIAARETAI